MENGRRKKKTAQWLNPLPGLHVKILEQSDLYFQITSVYRRRGTRPRVTRPVPRPYRYYRVERSIYFP